MPSTSIDSAVSYEGRKLVLTIEEISIDENTNTSTIRWILESVGGIVQFYDTGPTTVIINDETVFYKDLTTWDTGEFPAAIGSVSGEMVIQHDSEGNATISFSLATAIYYYGPTVVEGSLTLTTIAPYAKVLVSVNGGEFRECPVFVSVNGGGFTQVKKNDLKVL